MSKPIRERIENAGIIHGRMHEAERTMEANLATAYRLREAWAAGNLIPADEVDARIAEAVRKERARCAEIAEAVGDVPEGEIWIANRIAAAIRESATHSPSASPAQSDTGDAGRGS